MSNVIARVGVYGDIHLSSKNYGAHRDYPKESLEYFHKITEVTQKRELTHLIGLGDFSFGRFNSNEYRAAVNKELREQYNLVGGNRYEIFGNHDKAGYGMTERDYYIAEGLLKESTNLTLGCLNITMVDYGKTEETPVNIIDDMNHTNFILAHDFYKFENTQLPNYGSAKILDNMTDWFGADCLICGHVHKIMEFEGYIAKDDNVHQLKVYYPGCMTRPSYREGHIDEIGQVMVITVFDDNSVDIDIETIPLWSVADSFNLEVKAIQKEKKADKENRVDISDVVKQLDLHDRNVGNPEDIIAGMQGIDDRYKDKAINLLKDALA